MNPYEKPRTRLPRARRMVLRARVRAAALYLALGGGRALVGLLLASGAVSALSAGPDALPSAALLGGLAFASRITEF